jgi:hypothetical protein
VSFLVLPILIQNLSEDQFIANLTQNRHNDTDYLSQCTLPTVPNGGISVPA